MRFLIIFIIVLCLGCFNNSFEKNQKSLETSNGILIDSAKSIVAEIKTLGDNNIIKKADSVYSAMINMDALIDSYKEQIATLSVLDKDEDLAYKVIASPEFIKGALLSASSKVDNTVTYAVGHNSLNQVDNLLIHIRKVNQDSFYFEKTFKGLSPANALMVLSDIQLKSSEACNFALKSMLKDAK